MTEIMGPYPPDAKLSGLVLSQCGQCRLSDKGIFLYPVSSGECQKDPKVRCDFVYSHGTD